MENRILIALVMIGCLGAAVVASAQELPVAPIEEAAPQLPIPRFVTLASDEVNLRTGPGLRYPIKLILKKDGLPVEIIKEFDVWRQIRDMGGDEGWVHKSLLSGKRAVIITGHIETVYKKPDAGSRPVVKLEPGVIASLDHCDDEWCYLKIASYRGWLKRAGVWGVYPDERFGK